MSLSFVRCSVWATLLFLFSGWLSFAPAQPSREDAQIEGAQEIRVPQLSDQARVSLVTYSPGDELYAAFGHSCIRIEDEALGFDRLYNYGTFDFDTPNFYLKFARGDLIYILAVGPALAEMSERGELGQGVTEQVLDLSQEQKQALFQTLEINLLPENRGYLYDFLLDNCSTRIRDVFEKVLGQPLGAAVPPGQTFRGMLDPYLQRIPWTRFGLYLLLGAGVDRKVDPRTACFLPADLERAVLDAKVNGHPLVSDHRRYFEPQPLPQPVSFLMPLPVLLTLTAVWLAVWWVRGRARSTRCSAFLFCVVGLTGAFILAVSLYTRYSVAHENWNLAWLFPAHAWAGCWLLARAGRAPSRLLRWYFGLTTIGLAAFALLLPWLPQRFLWADGPVMALVAWRGWLEFRAA
ncbi:MAG: DUF4105 domain-containing protein [Verrucomicrobia bacterium]|nr:DUF4105 domain-containing protein [Verrucomicrobiota bacterium]